MPRHEGLPPAYIWPPAIDPLTPKNMALSPEDASLHRRPVRDRRRPPAPHPGLPLRPVEGPARRDRRVADRRGRATRDVQLALVGSMAHDDPEGWDYYNQTVAAAGRRPGHLHPLEPEQRRLGRGERVPGALGGARAEVDPGGLRAHGHRGALEGEADRRGARRAGSSTRSRTARPASSSIPSRSVPRRCRAILDDPPGARADGASRQGVRAPATSSRRGSCGTGSRCSTAARGTTRRRRARRPRSTSGLVAMSRR